MRIGIDCTSAVRQGAGIGRYTRNLVQALLALDAENDYVLLAATGGLAPAPSGPDGAALGSREAVAPQANVRAVNLPVSDRLLAILWHRLRLPLWAELFCGRLDVFHSPDFTLPPVRRACTVLTVHDLSFMRVPESSAPRLRAYLLQAVPRSASRADVILADSQCTRADVIELLHVDPGRVKVLYPGVEERFKRVQQEEALASVRRRYSLPERFVLSLGTLQPRKNYERLIEAFSLVRKKPGTDIKLVIVGGLGWMYEGISRRVAELGLSEAVCFLGYAADQDLPALYSLADLFAFPSLYEGFGLPPLEAMACGTPVVTSNLSSLPEVVGEAAVTVDPLDVPALAEAMSYALNDDALRQGMGSRGLARAEHFRWPDAAAKLLEAYRQLG